MFSLIYPLDPSPYIGPKPRKGEVLPLVEPSGLVVGRSSRKYCHSGSLVLHPVVHLHIINRMGQIYLQKRGKEKEICPNMWDTAVGGHIPYGEQPEEALFREAQEELGFTDFNPIFLKAYEFEGIAERELVLVYATITSITPNPDGYEVQEGRWWTPEELAAAPKGTLTPNFESEYKDIKHTLEALL